MLAPNALTRDEKPRASAGRKIVVRAYRASDYDAVARLNTRLRNAGVADVAYQEGAEQHVNGPITERLLVAVDENEVRGLVWLREHPFRFNGSDQILGWPKYLLAESLIDSAYAAVPRMLLRAVSAEQPLLLGLGFGGHHSPMPRLLAAHKWTGMTVPFLFRPLRPGRVARQLGPVRHSAWRKVLAAVGHRTGALWLAWQAYRLSRARNGSWSHGLTVEEVPTFDGWADDVWHRCADEYQLLTVRSAEMLTALYPPHIKGMHRLRVRRGNQDIGWVLAIVHKFSEDAADRMFGALKIGMIADMMGPLDEADAMMKAAVDWLAAAGADIVISNQSHPAWIRALQRAGLVIGPTNFALYRSPGIERQLPRDSSGEVFVHFNRGDGDGPIWWPVPR